MTFKAKSHPLPHPCPLSDDLGEGQGDNHGPTEDRWALMRCRAPVHTGGRDEWCLERADLLSEDKVSYRSSLRMLTSQGWFAREAAAWDKRQKKKNLKFANVKAVLGQCRGGLSRPLHSQWLRGVWVAGKEKLYVIHDTPTFTLCLSFSPSP